MGIFIDEIDAIGKQRAGGGGGGQPTNDEREQTLNQILTEMDGFEGNSGVIVLAATNRADLLDNALTRPGRFDRRVPVDLPDKEGRERILNVHARGKPLAEDMDLANVAARTIGFSGAQLENLMNEAAIVAARRDKAEIGYSEIDFRWTASPWVWRSGRACRANPDSGWWPTTRLVMRWWQL